jgi:hypothetical protein
VNGLDIQRRFLFTQQSRGNGRIRRALLWASVWASGFASCWLAMHLFGI